MMQFIYKRILREIATRVADEPTNSRTDHGPSMLLFDGNYNDNDVPFYFSLLMAGASGFDECQVQLLLKEMTASLSRGRD